MKSALKWIWKQGILSTFLAGLFAILPLVITVAILVWVAGHLHALLGPQGILGRPMAAIGLNFVADEVTAWAVGLLLVLVGIWVLGVLMKSFARHRIEQVAHNVVSRIPIVKGVYSTVAQVVGMLQKGEQTELASMSVVFCSFGQEHGGGFVCLLSSPEVYCMAGRNYHLLYLPTSPLPMTGGLIFVPAETVQKVDMSVEELMRLYLSMGILSPQVMPPGSLAGHIAPRP